MKWHKSLLIIPIILASWQNIHAQRALTLEQCIDYALKHNLDIKLNELQYDIQETNLLRSKASMLPSINGSGNYTNNWGKTIDRYTNQFADTRTSSVNLDVRSSVTLFNGFRLLNTVKKNKLLLEAQAYNLDFQRDMKSMEITTAFLQILFDQENLKSKIEQEKITQAQVDRTQKLVEAGSIANGDLYNIKSQLAIEQASKVDAENALNLSMLNLKQLMYLPGDTNIEIFAPEIALTEGVFQIQDPYKVYDYALKNRPEIKSAEIQVETAAKDLSIARSGISPSLSLSAGLGSGYSGATSILDGSPIFNGFNPNGNLTASGEEVLSPSFDYSYKTKAFTDQFKDNKNYFVGFSLNVPIFNGLQTHTAINQSEIAVKQAEVELDRSKREMRQTIEQAYADARSASKRYQAVQIQVQALEEAFTYATQRYEAKMTTAFEYNDAKLKLEIAKSDLLNAKYNYVFRVKVLDFYYGKPLTL